MSEKIRWDDIEKVLMANGFRMEWQDPASQAIGDVKVRQSDNFHWEIHISKAGIPSTESLISDKGRYISTLTDSGVSTFEFSLDQVYEFFSSNKIRTSSEFRDLYPQPSWIPGTPDKGTQTERERELERQRERERRERERLERERQDRERQERERREREQRERDRKRK